MLAFDAVRRALLACDAAAIEELYAEDYEDLGIRGETADKKAVLECFKPGAIKIGTFACRDVRAEVIGTIGIVRGKGHIRGAVDGGAFEHHVVFTDIFIFRDSRWRYFRSQSTEIAGATPVGS